MVEPDTNKVSRTSTRSKKAGVAPSRNKRRKSFLTAKYIGVAAALAMLVNLAVGYWGHQNWIQQKRLAQFQTLTHEHARTTADAVADQLRYYQKQLRTFAQTSAATSALTDGSAQALATLEERLLSFLPVTTSVHAIPVGDATLQSQTNFRFTELDMISRAEEREQVMPEATRQDDQWLVKLVVPVPAEAEAPVRGTLLVSLPIKALLPALEQGNQNLGRAGLQQSFNDQHSTLLLASGQGQGDSAQVADVPGSYWHLQFSPSAQLWQQTQVDLLIPAVVWGLFATLNLGLAILLGRWLGRVREHDREPRSVKQAIPETTTGTDTPEDILDVEISDEDEALLGLGGRAGIRATGARLKSPAAAPIDVPEVIFRAYDIRGLAETEITPQLAHQIGQAVGSEALEHSQKALVVARDGRTHSPLLAQHLVEGILSTGCGVINLGAVPTPLMYFATETLTQTQSGVMVTASHNGPEYNGFKVVINGKSRSADDIKNLRRRILTGNFRSGRGQEEYLDIVPQYISTIVSDVALAGDMHLVLDAGNGIAGQVAPRLFKELGCRVTPLFCELDGSFPNHSPDPSIADNLKDLVARVQEEKADVGIAFDGDGDRLTVVTPRGQIVWADRLLMIFARDIVARNPGADVVFDVKSTRLLNSAISNFGGRPVMWKTGHAPMRAKMLETGALVGAEFSGHVFIKDRWYGFDDGIYAAARLAEIISLRNEDLDSMLAEFPPTHITPEILIPVAEDKKFAIVRQLQENGDFDEARLTTLDGLRADFPYGWGLVRASNTSANLTLRFEAETESELHKIKALFARELNKIDSGIHFD